MSRLVCKRSFCNGKFRSKIDLFEDVFGLMDSEEEGFVGFDAEDIERLGALEDSSGEEEEQQELQAEDLRWTRQVLQLKNQFSGRLLARKIPITAICLAFLRTVFPVEVFELIVAETNFNVAIQENADKESKDPDWNEWRAKRIDSRRTESIPGSANSEGNHRVFAIAPELPQLLE